MVFQNNILLFQIQMYQDLTLKWIGLRKWSHGYVDPTQSDEIRTVKQKVFVIQKFDNLFESKILKTIYLYF